MVINCGNMSCKSTLIPFTSTWLPGNVSPTYDMTSGRIDCLCLRCHEFESMRWFVDSKRFHDLVLLTLSAEYAKDLPGFKITCQTVVSAACHAADFIVLIAWYRVMQFLRHIHVLEMTAQHWQQLNTEGGFECARVAMARQEQDGWDIGWEIGWTLMVFGALELVLSLKYISACILYCRWLVQQRSEWRVHLHISWASVHCMEAGTRFILQHTMQLIPERIKAHLVSREASYRDSDGSAICLSAADDGTPERHMIF